MSFIRPKTSYRAKTALITTIIGHLVLYEIIIAWEVETRVYRIVLLAFTVNCRRCKASVHDIAPWARATLCRIICLIALFQFCCVLFSLPLSLSILLFLTVSPTTFYFPLFIQFHLTILFFCFLYYFSSLDRPV